MLPSIHFDIEEKKKEYSNQNLRNRIFSVVKEAIISGFYTPGQKVTENQIADIFECSRTPVREALRGLEENGFIKVMPGIGMEVSPLNEDMVKQEFEIRKILEIYAVEAMCEKVTDEQIKKLKNVNKNIEWSIENEDYIEATIKNIEFHSLIYSYSGNYYLKRIEEILWASLRLSFLASQSKDMIDVGWDKYRLKEHYQLLRALADRDKNECRKIISQHIEDTYQYCLKYIQLQNKPSNI